MTISRNLIFVLALFFLVIFTSYAKASWLLPTATPPKGTNPPTFPALNTSPNSQEKLGGLILNNSLISQNGGFFTRIGVGTASSDKSGGIDASGPIKADKFCLGVNPAPEGCISNWSAGIGLSGGQPDALFLWLTGSSMGPLSISESGDSVMVGTVASPKGLSVAGATGIETGVKLKSGLTLSQLAGATTATASNKILSIDKTTGEVILVNADCSQ